MPHEIRNTKVRVRKDLITETPFILVEGLNVNPAAWDLTTGNEESLDLRIDDFNITTEEEKVYLNFSASQPQDKGRRISTFPVKLAIDGKLYRYVSVGARNGVKTSGRVTLTELTPGKHEIRLGDLRRAINHSNGETNDHVDQE